MNKILLVDDEKPTLVVLDLMLPDLNDEEVCSQFGTPLGQIFFSEDFWIDLKAERVFRNNHEVHLTPI